MLDSSGLPAAPSDLGSLGRRLVQLERLVELMGGQRALTSASIGKGGLRVIKGGGITVEDGGGVTVAGGGGVTVTDGGDVTIGAGGSLTITAGNLVLGAGKIDGAALKSQLEPQAYQDVGTGFSLSTSFASKASVSVAVPSWATSTKVQAYAVANLVPDISKSDLQWNAQLRLSIGGTAQNAMALPAANTSATGTAFRSSGAVSGAADINTASSKTIAVGAQLRGLVGAVYPTNSGNTVALYVVALFFR